MKKNLKHLIKDMFTPTQTYADTQTWIVRKEKLSFLKKTDADVKKAKQIVTALLADDERVLAEPAPQVFASKLAEDHIEITAWPFVLIADLLPFQKDIVENVLKGFEQAGIVIPLPQQEVRLLGGE